MVALQATAGVLDAERPRRALSVERIVWAAAAISACTWPLGSLLLTVPFVRLAYDQSVMKRQVRATAAAILAISSVLNPAVYYQKNEGFARQQAFETLVNENRNSASASYDQPSLWSWYAPERPRTVILTVVKRDGPCLTYDDNQYRRLTRCKGDSSSLVLGLSSAPPLPEPGLY